MSRGQKCADMDETIGLYTLGQAINYFAREYNFTEEKIQIAKEYQKEHNKSFTTAVLDLHIIDLMFEEKK